MSGDCRPGRTLAPPVTFACGPVLSCRRVPLQGLSRADRCDVTLG
jgi:hypothetical protein